MTFLRFIVALMLISLLALTILGSAEHLQQSFTLYIGEIKASLTASRWVVLVLASSILSALGLPRQAIALAYGNLLGGTTGALLATAVAVSGCIIDFYFARCWLRAWLSSRYPQRCSQLDGLLRDSPFLKALALRLFPSGSNLLTSLLGGTSSVKAPAFILGSGLGYLPQMFFFAYLGAGANWAIQQRNSLSIALLAVTIILAIIIILLHRRKHQSN